MAYSSAVLLTLVLYNSLLIAVGLWARGRNQDAGDFYLGGRRLGPWISAVSASASSSSAWTLLGVSGAAYAWGLPALWLFPATVGGFVLNWVWVAPRLMALSGREGAITLSMVVAPASLGDGRSKILKLAAAIIVFCFVFYVASQFEAAGKSFESLLGIPRETSILAGALVILVYTLLGGFWAVSVTDTLQGLLMCAVAVMLPLVCIIAASSGTLEPGRALTAGSAPYGALVSASGLLFVMGTLGIGIGYPGQPHVVNRFMAIRDVDSLGKARVIALTWAVLVYSGMISLGLFARALVPELGDSEQVMFRVAQDLLPAVLAGIVLAAVLSAIMSTADSQLLVAASALSHDWNAGRGDTPGLARHRVTVLVIVVAAVVLALGWQADIFSRVLFAWAALGAAFGPLLLLRLAGREISVRGTAGAMVAGFGLTVILSWLPDTPGDAAERLLPFVAALVVALISSVRRD